MPTKAELETNEVPPTTETGIDDGSPDPRDFHRHEFHLEGQLNPDVPTPDVNIYQHKKTLAQGMMDLALLSANANQLRFVMENHNQLNYFYTSLSLISISISLQIGVGVMLIWNGMYNVNVHRDMCRANRINNYTVIGIFIVTITNVFISVFAINSPAAVLSG